MQWNIFRIISVYICLVYVKCSNISPTIKLTESGVTGWAKSRAGHDGHGHCAI